MLDLTLQVWGGLFYLLNKVFLAAAERKPKTRWRTYAWVVYLIGLPPWVWIFVLKHNWIAASLEAAGAPSMFLGLAIALGYLGLSWLRWLDRGSLLFVILGICYSLYDFGGLVVLNQYLELAMAVGFLVGTYLIAKLRPAGYLWFLLMNAANAALMAREHYPWLVAQQILSIIFVADAFYNARKSTS